MRAALLLTCLLTLPLAAHAATPTQRAEAEARQYLSPCQFADESWQFKCHSNQHEFVIAYVYAFSGDTSSMGAVAAAFAPADRESQDDVNDHIGMPVSFAQACAWRIAVATSMKLFRGLDMVPLLCANLMVNDLPAAFARAQQILTLIQTAPAVAAPDFDPEMPGLGHRPKVDPKCLDSTVQPLTADPTAEAALSPPPPPKGCPGNP